MLDRGGEVEVGLLGFRAMSDSTGATKRLQEEVYQHNATKSSVDLMELKARAKARRS